MADEIGYVKANLPGWASLGEESHETNPALMWPLSIEVYDKMRREDAQVGSVIRAVTLPIRATAWEIEPAGARDEVVQLVAEDLGLPVKGSQEPTPRRRRERGRFSWDEFLRLALLELVFGFSVFEQVYRIDAGQARLDKLAWRPPRTIMKFEVAKDGGLIAIEQWGVFGSATVRIPVDRLVVFVNEREGADWLGQSLLRQAYKNWLLKDRFLRVQLLVGERNGLGVPVYTGPEVPEGLKKDPDRAEEWLKKQQAEGLKLATEFRSGEAAGASIPNGATLSLKGVDGKLPDMDGPIKYHDEQIAKAVLAHFLTLGGDNSTGSYALGDTFADFFTGSLNAVANQIADVVQQHIIDDLVDMNWGPDEPAPRLVPKLLGKDHPITAEAISALLNSGAFKHDIELEKVLRKRYGLPEPVPKETAAGENVSPEAALAAVEVARLGYLATDKVPLHQRELRSMIAASGFPLEKDGPDIQRVPDAAAQPEEAR